MNDDSCDTDMVAETALRVYERVCAPLVEQVAEMSHLHARVLQDHYAFCKAKRGKHEDSAKQTSKRIREVAGRFLEQLRAFVAQVDSTYEGKEWHLQCESLAKVIRSTEPD